MLLEITLLTLYTKLYTILSLIYIYRHPLIAAAQLV